MTRLNLLAYALLVAALTFGILVPTYRAWQGIGQEVTEVVK